MRARGIPILLILAIALSACERPASAPRDAGRSAPTRVHDELPESCLPNRRLPARPVRERIARPERPPRIPVVSLLDGPIRTEGNAPRERTTLLRFDERAIGRFERRVEEGRIVFTTPTLPRDARDARTLRLSVRAPETATVHVVALSSTRHPYDRARRTVSLPFAGAVSAGDVHDLTIDLAHAVHDNWRVGTEAAGERYDVLEIALENADASSALVAMELDGELSRYDGPAGIASIERDGIVRPSLFVRPGVRAVVHLRVPAAAPVLRFHASSAAPGSLRLAVREAGAEHTLAEVRPRTWWTAERVDLAAYAGREVDLVIESRDAIAFLGTPEIVGTTTQRAPDVVVYLVDLMLATQLGAYGNPRPNVSPTIDRLLREGLAFGRARSTSPWTKPAVPTLLTGIHPSVHGVGAHTYLDRLPATVEGMQHRFRANGHRTGSFAASPLGSTLSGLEVGFDVAVTPSHFDRRVGPMGQPTAAQLNQRLLAFVDEEPERPFFAFVHSLDVHEYKLQYYRNGAWPDDRPYDRAVRQQDRALAELLEELGRRERDVLVVLVGDHGESFGEFGRSGHGTTLYLSQLHVPLVFHWPGHLPSAAIDDPVSLADVAPSIVDLFSFPALDEADGSSVMSYAFDGRHTPIHDLVTSSREWFPFRPTENVWYAAEDPAGNKVIHVVNEHRWFFDLRRDSCERHPLPGGDELHARLDAEVARLAERARAFAERHGPRGTTPMEPADVERLRALGYVH